MKTHLFPPEILRRIPRDPPFDLRTILGHFEALTQRVWSENVALTQFTDHGPDHTRRIARFLQQLESLLPRHERLSGLEWFVLLAAACAHDLGMQWPTLVREFCPREIGPEQNETWERTRLSHVTRSCNLLSDIVAGKGKYYSAYMPLAHFGASPKHDFLPLLSIILTVIGAHSRGADGLETHWRRALTWDAVPATKAGQNRSRPDHFRMPLVAALFRLADELDASHVRVPNVARLLASAVDNPSLLYWVSCYFAAGVVVDVDRRTFYLQIDKAKMPNDPTLKELADFLVRDMVHYKLRRSFVKGITRDTDSIQRVLLAHGLPLVAGEPRSVAGTPPPEVSDQIEGFLASVLDYFQTAGFRGTVPFRSYAIQGATIDPRYLAEARREVRRVRLVDESDAVRVPAPLKESFARAQNLHSSRCLAFVIRKPTYHGEVLAFSEVGQRTTPATSAVLAAAAHFDVGTARLSSAQSTFLTKQNDGGIAVTLGRPERPFVPSGNRASSGLTIVDTGEHWQQCSVSPGTVGRSPAAGTMLLVRAVSLCGLHCLLWPPDFDFDPRLRNFFDESTTGPAARRRLWMDRVVLLEETARRISRVVPLRFSTVSILEESYPFRVLTFSTDSDSCVTFSGGAVAAAGCFALEHEALLATEADFKRIHHRDEFYLSVWYDRSQLFRIERTGDVVTLHCKVKHISDGRLFH